MWVGLLPAIFVSKGGDSQQPETDKTLINVMRAYCIKIAKIRISEYVATSLFVYCKRMYRGIIGFQSLQTGFKHLKEMWLCEDTLDSLLDQIADLHCKLVRADKLARKNLEKSQQKGWKEELEDWDKVLALVKTLLGALWFWMICWGLVLLNTKLIHYLLHT